MNYCRVPYSGTRYANNQRVKTAFTVWNGRIAPVFDTAKEILLVESAGARIVSEETRALPTQATDWLSENEVDAVVCGAISRPLQERLTADGVRVVPFVAGETHAVVRAWLDGTIGGAAFTMPGCGGRRRMRRGCCRRNF